MEYLTILASIFTTILSVSVGVYIATTVHYKNERKKQKIQLFGELMASRHELVEHVNTFNTDKAQFFYQLNKVFAVFHDSEEVKTALMNFHIDKNDASANMKILIIAICKDLKIDANSLPEGFIEHPFVPGLSAKLCSIE